MVPQPGIASVFGLPHHSTALEQSRLLSALATTGAALSFAELADGAEDSFAAYAALFALLARGAVVTVEMEGGAVGYRRPPKRRAAKRLSEAQLTQLRFAA